MVFIIDLKYEIDSSLHLRYCVFGKIRAVAIASGLCFRTIISSHRPATRGQFHKVKKFVITRIIFAITDVSNFYLSKYTV